MKIGVAIAPANALPSAFVVWRGLEESIRKAASFGYDGVELALADRGQVDVDQIRSWCKAGGIEVCAVSTGQVFATTGYYLTHADGVRRKAAIDCIKGLIDIAGGLGRKVNIGRVRGVVDENEGYRPSLARFVDSTRELADYALESGVEIILEPVNRYEINFVNSLDEAADVLQLVDRANMKLMPDVFHMNIEDDSIGASLVRYKELISYIHFADSNRLAPGRGHLNFPDLVHILRSIGYDGWVTVEILPKPDPDTAARQAIDYLRPLIPQG